MKYEFRGFKLESAALAFGQKMMAKITGTGSSQNIHMALKRGRQAAAWLCSLELNIFERSVSTYLIYYWACSKKVAALNLILYMLELICPELHFDDDEQL
jgi:hypothetical protein